MHMYVHMSKTKNKKFREILVDKHRGSFYDCRQILDQ